MARVLFKSFQTVQSSAFSNAKKLADLTIKRNVDAAGNSTLKGYQEAIAILEQFQFSDTQSEALDAQRLVQGYENLALKLEVKKKETNKTVGEFKINEREAFYVTPNTQFRSDTMFDIPEVVADTTEELRQLVFAVSNAVDEKNLVGESSGELEKYYFELYERYRMMEELNNDLLNEEISQEQALNGYGVFVDSDQNDGQIYGISVAPIGNLPQGLNQSDYQRIESSVNYGGGFVPVFSRFSIDEFGEVNARIGERVWSGDGKFALRFDKRKSNDRNYKEIPGGLNLSEFAPKKSTPIRPNKFFKGFTGFNDNGDPVQSLFFTSPNGKIYSVDDEVKEMLSRDFGKDIDDAVGVDSEFAKAILQNEDVQPLWFTPMLGEAQRFQAPPTPVQPAAEEQTPSLSSFFQRTNRLNVPERPQGMSFSTPDIIETGKSFFKKVGGFFTRDGVGSSQ